MSCPYYGHHPIPELQVLVDQLGNQCPLRPPYAPCAMETAGHLPNLQACTIAQQQPTLAAEIAASYTVVGRHRTQPFPAWAQETEDRSRHANGRRGRP